MGGAIVFTNTERGRVISTSATAAAITITGDGVRIINQSGALIRSSDFLAPAITGSQFADFIDNYGVISGVVRLGGGNDRYLERTSQSVSLPLNSRTVPHWLNV
jgi:succinate dehydrogenase/fumarate reductase flavoprotein subunit